MPTLPSSLNKILSSLSKKSITPSLPRSTSDTTLFDNLPVSEKQAAILKLHELADQQPGAKKSKAKRHFNWKYFFMALSALLLCVLAAVTAVLAVDRDVDPDLVAKLRMANTNLDRMKLLPNNDDWFFDFTKQDKYTFSPGGVVNANAATFPATVGQGMTMAMLNLGPCSMLPPHIHPRATNYVLAISGTTQTTMINENGAQTITEVLKSGQMTIFPQGSVHTMMNIGCENAQLVSALNSDDTGTTNLMNAFFGLPQNVTSTVLGQTGMWMSGETGKIAAVGTGSIAGPESCIAACRAQGKMIKREW